MHADQSITEEKNTLVDIKITEHQLQFTQNIS